MERFPKEQILRMGGFFLLAFFVGVVLGAVLYFLPPAGTFFLVMGAWIIFPALFVSALIGWISVLGAFVFTKKRPERSLVDFASGSSYLAFSCVVAMFTVWAFGCVMPA